MYAMLLILSLLFSNMFSAFGWSYDHPELWADIFPNCNLSAQSPVNIEVDYATYVDWWGTVTYFNTKNNSKVEYFLFISESVLKVQIYGNLVLDSRSLPVIFQTLQLHFHWRNNNITHGSAHYIDGKGFPLEMQVINKNSYYRDLTTAVHYPDGFAIMAFFFEIEFHDNPLLNKIIDLLPNLGSRSMQVEGFNLSELMHEGLRKNHFFQYNGSIPIPPCNECVIWIIVKNPLSISQRQLKKIWKLSKRVDMFDTNVRPVQPIYERLVWKNFSAADKAISSCFLSLISYNIMYLT